MKLTPVEAGRFKLDGGAMFGVVPKRIWNTMNAADEENMCSWSMRSLLIENGNSKILVDTGLGFKQGNKFRSHFYPHGQELEQSLQAIHMHPESVTDVFITHLHFDHVGGALKLDKNGRIIPTFPNAVYWSNEVHYNWAYDANPREKASFLKENFVPLKQMNKLKFIDVSRDDIEWMPGLTVRFIYGHTEAQMLLIIDTGKTKLVYCADLIPSQWHVRLPYIMAYDMHPLVTLEEKERLLQEAMTNEWDLFLEHDPLVHKGRVRKDDRGHYRLDPN